MARTFLIFTFTVLSIYNFVSARIISIPAEYASIQNGIDSSNAGDTVLVYPGGYYENLNFHGHSILLGSTFIITGDTSAITSTIINGGADGSVITLGNSENENTSIRGFTIENGLADFGGAISINGSSCLISDNIIIGNQTNVYGSAIYAIGSPNVAIEYNTISSNSGNVGTIFIHNSIFSISHNVICTNLSIAAIELFQINTGMIANNTIGDNNCGEYGQITVNGNSDISIMNNIVVASNGYGIFFFEDYLAACTFNDVWNNSAGNYYRALPGVGSVSENPIFSELYHLDVLSPCIDAGDPNSTLDPDGTIADMGAYFYDQGSRILPFHLIEPLDVSVINDPFQSLIWGTAISVDSTSSISYKVFWSNSPQFNSIDSSDAMTDTIYSNPLGFSQSQLFYWMVKASNGLSYPLQSSETWSFYVNSAPEIPEIIAPENGIHADSSTILIWFLASDPDSLDIILYSLQIDNNNDFTTPEIFQYGLGPEMIADDALAFRLSQLDDFENLSENTVYYWRVRSEDNNGLVSDWTNTENWFNFMPQNLPPFPPTEEFSPANGEEIRNLSPVIAWHHGFDPDNDISQLSYIIQLGDDSLFTSYLVYDSTATGDNIYQVSFNLTDNQHFYYRIKTIDIQGLISDWSLTQDFWTNQNDSPPGPFQIYFPDLTSVQINEVIEFLWAEAIDQDPFAAVNYSLQWSRDSLFIENVCLLSQIADTSIQVSTDSFFVYGNPIYWRLFAVDDDGFIRYGGMPEQYRQIIIYEIGDANVSNKRNGSDLIYLKNYLFEEGPQPIPLLVADTNGDCQVNSVDITYLLNYFLGFGEVPMRGNCQAR